MKFIPVPLIVLFQECALAESFMSFVDYCMDLIRIQREVYPAANKAAQYKIETILR